VPYYQPELSSNRKWNQYLIRDPCFMNNWENILSYIHPVTVEITSSEFNPVIEVVLYSGRLSLNSENTNYSYGTLHTLFERTFRRLRLNWNDITDVLILGFGTGSIASIIGKYKYDCFIDGVEIDHKIIELGEKYFNTGLLNKVTIYCAAADQFIDDCNKKYDLIIIDVYRDMNVPAELETEQFLTLLKKSLKTGGIVIFNKAIYSKKIREQIPLLKALYEKIFNNLEIMTVMSSGKIFIAKNLIEK
jgi:spermidine synthase